MSLLADAWLASLWRASWQGCAIAVAVWLICLIWRRIPSTVRCGLWWLACLKMLLALSAVAISVPVLPTKTALAVTYLAPPAQVSLLPPGETGQQAPKRAEALPPKATASPAVIAMVGWGFGCAVLFGLTLTAFTTARRHLRSAKACDDAETLAQAASIAATLGLNRPPPLYVTEAEVGVLSAGLWSPRVLISRRVLNECSPEERGMILAHEFAHLKRFDSWIALVPQAAQIAFFFHPMAWLAAREFDLAREAACDEIAIRTVAARPDRYGHLLLKLGTRRSARFALCLPGVSSQFRVLQRRITMLEKVTHSPSRRSKVNAIVLACLVAAFGVVPLSLVSGQTSTLTATHPKSALLVASTTRPARTSVKKSGSSGASKPIARTSSPAKTKLTTTPEKAKVAEVKTVEAKQVEPRSVRVFQLQYAHAASLSKILEHTLRTGPGSDLAIDFDARTNSIVSSGSNAQLEQLSDLLKNLDRPVTSSDDTHIVRIVKLRFRPSSEVKAFLTQLLKKDDEDIDAIYANDNPNELIVRGTEDKINRLQMLANVFDTGPEQAR